MIARTARPPGALSMKLRTLFHDAVRARCSENNCCLGLRGLSDYIILKGESILPRTKVCDCIIFHNLEVPTVILVELKRGLVHPGEIEEKFKNTLEWVSRTDKILPSLSDCQVVLVLLHGRGISKSDNAALRALPFRSKGKKHPLQVLPCSAQLADLYGRMTMRGRPLHGGHA